jgi:O-methyltransferase involved in polyketide biosynthesis
MSEKIGIAELREVPETLLIPLWARAQEARHPSPILHDRKAVEMIEQLDYDFRRFATLGVDVAGFCTRAHVFDSLVRQFLAAQPDGSVVEFGPGLDTRFDRLDNGLVNWYEVDLPQAMTVRRQFFSPSERRTMIAASALDPSWMEAVQHVAPDRVLFMAEGVFHYFPPPDLKKLLRMLADAFPGSRLLFDCQSPFYGWYARLRHPVKRSPFLFALRDIHELERWDPRLRVEQYVGFGDSPYYDPHFQRLSRLHRTALRLFPPVRHMFKISVVRLGELPGASGPARPAGLAPRSSNQ